MIDNDQEFYWMWDHCWDFSTDVH